MTLLLSLFFAAAPASAPVDARPTVAVLYFDYTGNDASLAVLKKGLAQILISDLSAIESVRFVERDRLQDVLDELKLGTTAKMDKTTVAKLGKLLGARYLIAGAYFDLLGALRVDARTIEVETGRIVRSVGASGTAGELMDVEQRISQGLAKVLTTEIAAVAPPAPEQVAAHRAKVGLPKTLKLKTALRYANALDAKDRKDKAQAKAELSAVAAEDPNFALAANDLKKLMQ
jgi:TolB-like protein